MKHRKKVFILVLLTISLGTAAQEKRRLSLDDAITMGVKNSKQLKLGQEKIDEATAALQESIEKKLPNASASASYLRLNNANFDLKSSNNNNNGGGGSSPKE